MQLLEKLKESRLVAAIGIDDPSKVTPLIEAMTTGGVNWIEFTFRNPKTADCLKILEKEQFPIHYGAGTVRKLEQAQMAQSLGAQYLVTPGYNPQIVEWANNVKMPIIPGIDSTFGIEAAEAQGIKTLKFFPAEISGGVSWLKAIKGPYFDINFIPTGGVSLNNMQSYLAQPNVVGVAGSFLAPSNLIKASDFQAITTICQTASGIVKELKQNV